MCGLFLLGRAMRPVGLIFRHVVGRNKSGDGGKGLKMLQATI
jgi:hypothetical protein